MKAVILAAGVGSRLAPYTDILPKPLMPITKDSGRLISIVELLIKQIREAGMTEIIIIVKYRADMIQHYLGDGTRLGVSLTYRTQEVLDGNAGAYYRAQDLIAPDEHVFITDCDNFLSDDTCIANLVQSHLSSGAAMTVGTFPVENIEKYAIIKTNGAGDPVGIYEKPAKETRDVWGNLAKSGMLMLSPQVAHLDRSISRVPQGDYTTTGIIAYGISQGLKVSLFPIACSFVDIGTWGDYLSVLSTQL